MPRTQKRYLIRDEYRHDFYATSSVIIYGGPASVYYHERRGNRLHGTRNTTITPSPVLSDLSDFFSTLETRLQENNTEALTTLLRDDFIFEYSHTEQVEHFHTNTVNERQGHIYTYQVCTVQKKIEFLVQEHPQEFRRLLKLAEMKSTTLYQTILKQLHDIDLENVDLSNLNLCSADFCRSNLKGALFTNSALDDALFIDAQLKETNITKKQLSSCKTYTGATLPCGFWPYWTEATKFKILGGLKDLKNYGLKLQQNGVAKGKEAISLALALEQTIQEPGVRYNESFQKKFLQTLHSRDSIFKEHRHYNRIIANIALCILSGIFPYLIAGAINKKLTGHFTFFAKTASQRLIDKIDQSFEHAPSPMIASFLLGAHPRLGKHSAIRSAFGQTRGRPDHPLGETQVLHHIKSFLY